MHGKVRRFTPCLILAIVLATVPQRTDAQQKGDLKIQTDALRLEFRWPNLQHITAPGSDWNLVQPSPLVSFRLHQAGKVRELTSADFTPAALETTDLSEGLFRGFRQWTLRGRNDQLELKLHVLAYPGEPSVIIEPEIVNHSGTECGLSDLRLHFAVTNRPGVNAELISGKPEYVVRLGAATYVMPYDSCTWRGSLADLAARPPAHNCGHVALTEDDNALAFWYPVGHNSNCGGRSGYVHMPLTTTNAGDVVRISFPLYQPCYGPDPAHVFPLKPGASHRSFGIVLTAGKTEHGDPWSVVRRARAAATKRAPAGKRPLPPVGGGTWNWPISDGSNFLESERQLYFRHPPKRPHPETPYAEDTCREEYIRALLPHWKALGCEFVWIDLLPLYTGTFEEATDRFPSGLKPLCEQLRREGLAVSMILMPDNLNFGKWNAALEARFGNCRHTNPAKNYLCLASPWGEYVAEQIARIVREYDLCTGWIAMNHNEFVSPVNGCEARDHGHAPTSENATDYARQYIAAHNHLYAQIRRAKPEALIFENLPTVYDLGNPMPDAIWVNDGFHIPQFMWLMLDYLAAQRRLWPMELRFTNYVSMNLEHGESSPYLVANIAFGNFMAIGEDLRHTPPKLKEFYRNWIAFYRAHREWLCTNIHLLAPNVIGHRLPGQFLVFVFNEREEPREMSVQFSCREAGLPEGELRVVEDSGDAQTPVGSTRPQAGQINWSQRVDAGGFRVLRFIPKGKS